MSWIKLDDQMADHPKLLGLGPLAPLALALQVRALCYAARYLTDGHLPAGAIPGLLQSFGAWSVETGGVPGLASAGRTADEFDWPALMVKAGLWAKARDGYDIHDYLNYNPTRASIVQSREANAKRQKTFRDRNGHRNGVSVPLVQAPRTPTPTPTTKHEGAPRRADSNRADSDSVTDKALMGLVRQHLYAPDDTPPPGYAEARDVTIIRALRKRATGDMIATAIEGLALLRDRGELDWLRPGTKATLRALYNTRTGVRPVFALAQETAIKHAARRRPDDATGVQAIGEIIRKAGVS